MSKIVQFRFARVLRVAATHHSPELDRAAADAIAAARDIDRDAHPILKAWRELFGGTGEAAAPQLLLELALRSGGLPQPDTITGACNLVSLRALAAVTAHDLARVHGDPHLIATTGSERFHPLGGERAYRLPPRQWAVVAGGRVLTHLDSRQSARTRVTLKTRDVLVCAQSAGTDVGDVLREACAAVVAFNGGRVMLE